MAWTNRVDQLLYDGETERRRVEFATATVVVTTHRVLAFTDGDGSAYRAIDRPNVGRVTVDTGGETRHLVRALPAGLIGTALLAVGVALASADLVPESSLEEPQGSGNGPVDGMTEVTDSAFRTVETILTVFELGSLLLSVLLFAVALVFCGLYARSRSRALVIRVRGDDDVEFPVTDADIEDGLVTALKEAVRPGPTGGLEPDATRNLEDGPRRDAGVEPEPAGDVESGAARGRNRERDSEPRDWSLDDRTAARDDLAAGPEPDPFEEDLESRAEREADGNLFGSGRGDGDEST